MTPVLSRALASLAGALALTAGALGLGARAADANTLSVSVTRHPVTRPLSRGFLGLALEYNTVPAWTAQTGQTADTTLNGLIGNLDPTGGALIRIGGQSTDRSWWPVPGMSQPLGVTASLGPAWAADAKQLATSAGAKLMLGINLETASLPVAREEGDSFVRDVGEKNIADLQIGNEPDLYLHTPWYRVSDGHDLPWYSHSGTPVLSRGASWSVGAFEQEFSATANVLPKLPLAGPDSGYAPWIDAFGAHVLTRHSRVRTLTTHAYGLNNCVTNPSSPEYPSVTNLLGVYASHHLLDGVAGEIGAAHRGGAAFRIDEMGSVTCNGHAGVSDTFASALWAADALFAVARAGVDGVNLHTYPDSLNGLFDLAYQSSSHRWRATVHPLYDGVLMFAQADPPGSRILRIDTPDDPDLRAWATLGSDGKVRVLLINDSQTHASLVHLHAPAGHGSAAASLERLLAPSASAMGGITLGGHRFSSTVTGVPHEPHLQVVRPKAGVLTLSLPSASAALLTLP